MKISLIKATHCELFLFALWHKEQIHDEFDECEKEVVDLSLVSLENHAGCTGIRLFVVAPKASSLDDVWGVGLFGIFRHYGRLCIEILFIKVLFT